MGGARAGLVAALVIPLMTVCPRAELGLPSARAATPGPLPTNGEFDLVEAALTASGYATASELTRARADFERHTGPLVNNLARISDRAQQAEHLLTALHRKGGLLGRYDPRATTLRDILERRAFNCVSASVLYNLVAHRLKLPVAAQLLPTHARSMLSLERNGRLVGVVIETTSARGFDPDPEQQASIFASVARVDDVRGRALVSDRGAIVDTAVLVGTIYVNRASIEQEAGRLARAEKLFALGQRLAPEPSMQRVLSDQRAALLSQLAADDITASSPARYERALRSLGTAARLSPSHPDIVATIQQNLRALAERLLSSRAQTGDEPGVEALAREIESLMAQPSARAGVRAVARGQVAVVRLRNGDIDGAVAQLERGLAEPLGPMDLNLRQNLRARLVTALRMGAFKRAEAGQYAESLQYLKKVEGLPLDSATRSAVRRDRSRVIHLVGERRIDHRDFTGAAEVYRQGLRRDPKDETSRHNLIVALERLARPRIDRGDCEDAARYLAEIRKVDPDAKFPAQAELRCIQLRTRTLLSAGDFAGAVRLLWAADLSDAQVRDTLSVALLRWTTVLVEQGRCREARIRARQARDALPRGHGDRATAALGDCR